MVSGQGSLTSECHCCVIAQLVTDFGTSLEVTEDVDRYVVVISGSGLDGLVVVPRQHIGGLEDLPAAYRACILATLRRATQSLQERNPGSATRIVALTDLPSSKGHVCFRVVVKGPEEDQYTSETRGGHSSGGVETGETSWLSASEEAKHRHRVTCSRPFGPIAGPRAAPALFGPSIRQRNALLAGG